MKPIAIDLFCGGFWGTTEHDGQAINAFAKEGYQVLGFDLVDQFARFGWKRPAGCHLVLQDIHTIQGSQFKSLGERLRCIVCSPPCTEYSYMAMPWKRAKQIARALRGQDEFPEGYKGSRSIEELNSLFNHCFRIQREASEALGQHIPMIVENVKGAQPWVGRSAWSFGSYFLWGDIPALMPITRLAVKINGQNWSNFKKQGKVSPHWRMEGLKLPPEISTAIRSGNSPARWTNPEEHYFGRKIHASCSERRWEDREIKRLGDATKLGGTWFHEYAPGVQGPRNCSSKSLARARASAEIAKIPYALASHIAKVFLNNSEHPSD